VADSRVGAVTFSFYSPIIVSMTGVNLGLPTAWVVKCKKCGCTINAALSTLRLNMLSQTEPSRRPKILSS